MGTDLQDLRAKIDLASSIARSYEIVGSFVKAQEAVLPFLDKHYGRLLRLLPVMDTTTQLRYLSKAKFLLQHTVYFFDDGAVYGFVLSFLFRARQKPIPAHINA